MRCGLSCLIVKEYSLSRPEVHSCVLSTSANCDSHVSPSLLRNKPCAAANACPSFCSSYASVLSDRRLEACRQRLTIDRKESNLRYRWIYVKEWNTQGVVYVQRLMHLLLKWRWWMLRDSAMGGLSLVVGQIVHVEGDRRPVDFHAAGRHATTGCPRMSDVDSTRSVQDARWPAV